MDGLDTCSIGFHEWENCRCTICGKTRDMDHDWSKNCGQCSICGQERQPEHTWEGTICAVCGETRDVVDFIIDEGLSDMLFRLLGINPDSDPGSVEYSGGSGSSIDDAVVIQADQRFLGIPAEYDYIANLYGPRTIAWDLTMQSLIGGKDGKKYDRLDIQLKDGTTHSFFFDITSFWGK